MSLLNRVPCVSGCQRSLRVNVLTFQCGLRVNVPARQRAKNMPSSLFYVPMFQLGVPTCQTVCQLGKRRFV